MNEKYLYLSKVEWADTWISGGLVPLNLASKYRSEERNGTLTPDESIIQTGQNLSGEDADLIKERIIGPGGIAAKRIQFPSGKVLNNGQLDWRTCDGVILCLSNVGDVETCKKLGKVCCIKIPDPKGLFDDISKQLKVMGRFGDCTYTKGPERDLFTKSEKDSWQSEFRMCWPVTEMREVRVRKNTAMLMFPKGIKKYWFSLFR